MTERYRAVLREAHAEPGWGTSADMHIDRVAALAVELSARTILDYGCGKGVLGETLEVTNYDPVTFPDRPEPHDLVVCLDVMEHVERDLVANVLWDIRQLTLKGALFVISCQPAKKMLPDGRNAHITIEKPEWWRARLEEARLKPELWTPSYGNKAVMAVCKPV